ncbi:MAG: hypothetical protein KJO84_07375 [Acidimicrobiia bacterium]|nr:hypothetical protein [Acidimicrobiia bacterium]
MTNRSRPALRTTLLLAALAVLATAACGGGVAVTEAEERWCRSDPVSIKEDAVSVAFERIHGVELLDAKAEFGWTESAGAQVGSRMTITNPGGFPSDEARDAWYDSDKYVAACRAAFDDYN